MRVQVDEPGADDHPGAIEHARLALHLKLADGDDAIVFDGDIADLARLIGAVVDRRPVQDDIGLDRCVRLGERQRGKCDKREGSSGLAA